MLNGKIDENLFGLELDYLQDVQSHILFLINQNEKLILDMKNQINNLSQYLSEQFYFIDNEEKGAMKVQIAEFDERIFDENKNCILLHKQKKCPYFGKVEFKQNNALQNFYIGISSLIKNGEALVCDWRAPVSCLYYDFELGNASYTTDDEIICGEIERKLQFKIVENEMEHCFSSSVAIADSILESELAHNTSSKMKNIISTLQKEQNKLVRSNAGTLILQGVAGSGKTSIALHRVAYLLYKEKNTLKSSDILIVSPNKTFSSYISNVLPSLNEENIESLDFFELASRELEGYVGELEDRSSQIESTMCNVERLNNVAYKNSFEFFESMKEYLNNFAGLTFCAKDIKIGEAEVKADVIDKLFNQNYKQKAPSVRIEWIAEYVADELEVEGNYNFVVPRIKKMIYSMFDNVSMIDLYATFLFSVGMTFERVGDKIKNEDIAPLLYIKNYMLGLEKFVNIKHLVVDEMQDYSFFHFCILNSIFDCNKTIVGDINQCIDKMYNTNDLEKIAEIFENSTIEFLNKTYRCTRQITEFANKVKNIECESVARNGDEVEVVMCGDFDKQIDFVIQKINQNKNQFNTIAVICKNQKQAQKVYDKIFNVVDVNLIKNTGTVEGVMVISSALSKGLEFDMVICFDCSKQNYQSFMDKNLLYVNCTRALHKLVLTYEKSLTKFVELNK